MKKMNLPKVLLATVLLGGLLVTVGCYESKSPLGSLSSAIVDVGYVGDFSFNGSDNKTSTIIIRNIDDKQCYVEWKEGDKTTGRFVGFTSDVKGVTFASLRPLTDDGKVPEDYLIMRVSISPDHSQLTLQNLDDKFFKDKDVDTSGKLRQVITDNLDNKAMYDGDPAVANRIETSKQ